MRSCNFSGPENEVDLILLRAGIFETLTDIDDFTMLVGVVVPIVDVECLKRCSAIDCKGRVKSIAKADRGIGKRVLQIVLTMSGKLVPPGSGK